MTISTRTATIVGAVALALLGYGLWTWHQAAIREVKAEMNAQKQDAIIQQHQQAIQERDRTIAAQREQTDAQMADIRTMKQGVAAMQKAMKDAATAVHASPQEQQAAEQPILTVNAGDLPASLQQQLPNSPSYAVMSEAQATLWGKIAVDYPVIRQELAACSATNADLRAITAAAEQKAQGWERAAKGGSTFERVVKEALKMGAVGSIAYLAGRGMKK